MLFIPLAVAFALFNRKHDHLLLNTIVGVALLIVCIAVGIYCPIYFSKNLWLVVVFAYIFIASVAPVWILLQSRDYLNSFLLYFMIAAAVIGVVFTNPSMEIEETGGANFLFVTKSGKVVTPKSDSILPDARCFMSRSIIWGCRLKNDRFIRTNSRIWRKQVFAVRPRSFVLSARSSIMERKSFFRPA